MEQENKTSQSRGHFGRYVMAILFVAAGVLLFARNMGWIAPEVFSTIVSWQSLLIILGVYSIAVRNYLGGIIMLFIGGYFMMRGAAWFPENTKALIWPLVLVGIGLYFMIGHRHHARGKHGQGSMHHHHPRGEYKRDGAIEISIGMEKESCESEDGFLRSENTFGSVRHVVLDELFKGADIKTNCGGTTIDLRRTHIAQGETYIDIDCSLGGVEIYVPSDWVVVFKCNTFFGGCDDKRWQDGNKNEDGVLVLRGKLSFGGLEVKD